ncbi:MAG: response regulator transcription factor [Betaproteobacteria bacterium]|nr:response regulator transcription factor [Betaproteobacteria bacterium]
MKAILADDHALFRDGFALLLKQLEPQATVLEAASLYEVVHQAERNADTDLVLLDLSMPGMEGIDSVRDLLNRFPDIPVVILSATDSRPLVEALLEIGVAGFIPKSSSSQVMFSALRLVLSGSVYIPPQLLGSAAEIADGSVLSRLTDRQREVLRLLADGKTNKQICRDLELSEGTVKVHLNAVYRVLGVANRTEAALLARRLNLV